MTYLSDSDPFWTIARREQIVSGTSWKRHWKCTSGSIFMSLRRVNNDRPVVKLSHHQNYIWPVSCSINSSSSEIIGDSSIEFPICCSSDQNSLSVDVFTAPHYRVGGTDKCRGNQMKKILHVKMKKIIRLKRTEVNFLWILSNSVL